MQNILTGMNFQKINTEEDFKESLFPKLLFVNRLSMRWKNNSIYFLDNIYNNDYIVLYYCKEKDFFYCNGLGLSWFKKNKIPYTIIDGIEKNMNKMIKINGNIVSWEKYEKDEL